jgi:hypothetical protein
MDFPPAGQDNSVPSSPSAAQPGGLLRVFNRVFSRHLMNAAILMVLPMIFASTLNSNGNLLYDPDIWWHLANARVLAVAHHFVRADIFSFTVIGQQWINWEWLSELVYWFSYRAFGLRGIYLIAWLALCANALFVYWRGFWSSRHRGAALWAAGLAFFLMTVSSGPRCINIAYLAMSAEMAILEAAQRGHKRLLWLLPPLFCLWVNLHGIWFIGIALMCLYIVCGLFQFKMGVFEQEALSRSDRNHLLAVLGVTVAALLVNPDGWRLLWNPLDMMFNQKLNIGVVGEWQPLHVDSPLGIFAVLAIGLMILANCMRGRKWTVFEMAIVFFAWFAALDHMRFTFLAAVLTTPMLARDIERSFIAEPDNGKTIPAMNALIAAGAVGLILYMIPSQAVLEKKAAEAFPLHIIASIQPSWRTFNVDHVGGRMDFDSKPCFIDSRFEIFEHRGVLQDYIGITNLHGSIALLEKYRIDHALIQEDTPVAFLLHRTPGWSVQMNEKTEDGDYLLFARTPGAESGSATFAPPAGANKP